VISLKQQNTKITKDMALMKPFYDIYSKTYLATFFCFALLETLLCSGITYGWASIVVIFKEQYFYMDLCVDWYRDHNKTFPGSGEKSVESLSLENMTIVGGGAGYFNDGKLPGCPIQDARLNLIFTVSLFCLCGVKFPAGVFIDRCGPRIARLVGGIMYIIACVGLGFVAVGYENLLFPVFAMICMGGSLLVVSVYQVANIIYRESRSKVMCILHGAFDSSAVVLLVFKLIYERGVNFQYVMFGYAIICLIIIVIGSFVLIPPLSVLFHWVDEENEINQGRSERVKSISGPDFVVKSLTSQREYTNVSVNYGSNENSLEVKKNLYDEVEEYNPMDSDDDDYDDDVIVTEKTNDELPLVKSMMKSSKFPRGSVLRSIFSLLYMFELVFLLTFQLKLWYFVGSLADFLERLSLNKTNIVSEYINLFGYIQFGGLLVTPIIGFVFDKSRLSSEKDALLTPAERRLQRLKECIMPFVITNVLCIVFCILSLVEDVRIQVPSYILYTTVRGFLYANHGAFMGCAFPASQFGTLYGLGIFVGGTFGILQYALFEFTAGPLNGNPFWTNMILLILVCIGNIHPLYLWWYCRKENKRIHRKKSCISKPVSNGKSINY